MPQNTDTKSTEIIIDLNETDTKSFENNNFIQTQARDKLFELMNKFISNIPKEFDPHERLHHTILIQGKRGSGKTSFILSVKKQIENNFQNSRTNIKTPENLIILNIIDPTLIESKEHVFINIITRIKEKVEDFMQCNRCTTNDANYKNWKEALKNLAGGLSMLDGVGGEHLKDNLWDSPELSLEKGLSNSKHGYKLEENFKKFVHMSLQVLNKSAFVLILDDIDTSLKEGRIILETIRKYLTSPELITIILGDIELYTTLVRQLQWEKIDPVGTLAKYELNDTKSKEAYLDQIAHLEEQYLTKILMPQNRINLQNLFEISKSFDVYVEPVHGRAVPIADYIKEFVKSSIGVTDNHLLLKYIVIILNEQIRSTLQLFNTWNNKRTDIDAVYSFQHIYFTTLNKEFRNYDFLNLSQDISSLTYTFGLYLANQTKSKKQSLSHLELDLTNRDLNIVIMYLGMLFSIKLDQANYLSYMLKIGYVFTNFPYWDDRLKKARIKILENDKSTSAIQLIESVEVNFGVSYSNLRSGHKSFGTHFVRLEDYLKITNKFILENVSVQYKDQDSHSLYNFISFFKLLGFIADFESNPINASCFEYCNDLNTWALLSNRVEKLPISTLTSIWERTTKVINTIDGRNENLGKPIKHFFSLYIAGFLNTVLLETGTYKSVHQLNNYNVSTSQQLFLDNLRTTGITKEKIVSKEKLSYFEYIYLCPLLDIEHPIFQDFIFNLNAEKRTNESRNNITNTKSDFTKLAVEKQIEAIKAIEGWEKYSVSTITNRLRYNHGYKNCGNTYVLKLLNNMKK